MNFLLWLIYRTKRMHLPKVFLFGLFVALVFSYGVCEGKPGAVLSCMAAQSWTSTKLPFILAGVFFDFYGWNKITNDEKGI